MSNVANTRMITPSVFVSEKSFGLQQQQQGEECEGGSISLSSSTACFKNDGADKYWCTVSGFASCLFCCT